MSLRLVLLGPPGSGKGTLAHELERRVKVAHLSTGDIFRREIKQRTALGRQVERYVKQGLLVPDEVVVGVMTHQLTRERLRQGFVLDGFPRTVGQAQGLDEFLRRRQPLDGALSLTCSLPVLVERLGGRRVCSGCGANYHLRSKPPIRPGVCDQCGNRLVIREDDHVETIKKRLVVDRAQAKPLLAYYTRQALLHRLNGNGSSDAVFARTLRLCVQQGWLKSRER
ncbi:MAG: nucleoside monophosphate kinase [Candidatus Omnitrophica bacterium]|nr:nucleoside monophosphate kinase [Candidatus Omnitrophota bacterium]